MLVSIVMPYYKRGIQLDRTLDSISAQNEPVEVIIVPDIRHRIGWMNPAALWNEGIERATGDILILQNPECLHITRVIYELTTELAENEARFASVMALNADGSEYRWYCHSEHRRQPWFFCGALHKSLALRAGKFNTSFTGYGGEDVDFAQQLQVAGANFVWRDDILVHHQWHGYPEGVNA